MGMDFMRTAILGAAASAALASAAVAGDLGVDFGSMPTGCTWHTEWSDGARLIETYMGRVGKEFVVKTVREDDPNVLVRRAYFTADGHILRSEYADGSWQKMEPHSCFTILGKCEYRVTFSTGVDWHIKSDVRKMGKRTYFSKSYIVGGNDKEHWEETFKVGPYNLLLENRAGKEWTRSDKLEGCGAATS